MLSRYQVSLVARQAAPVMAAHQPIYGLRLELLAAICDGTEVLTIEEIDQFISSASSMVSDYQSSHPDGVLPTEVTDLLGAVDTLVEWSLRMDDTTV